MKEWAYIDAERMEEALKRAIENSTHLVEDEQFECHGFAPQIFPDRTATPIVRRRTKEHIKSLIENSINQYNQ